MPAETPAPGSSHRKPRRNYRGKHRRKCPRKRLRKWLPPPGPRPAQRLGIVHHRPDRLLVRQLVALEQRAHVLPAAGIGHIPQRVELSLLRELATERMPQPARAPLALVVA